MVNKTANQHYVAQGEQKIELVNGEVVTDRRTLNRFRISDRETWSVGAGRQIGIKSCLAVKHLFTFGRASDTEFYNFEEYFERYEQAGLRGVKGLIRAGVSGAPPSGQDVLDALRLKFLNTFRNPFCIRHTLNTLGSAATVVPNHPRYRQYAQMIDGIPFAETAKLRRRFGVSHHEYCRWLRTLSVVLFERSQLSPSLPAAAGTLLDEVIQDLLVSDDHMSGVRISSVSPERGEFVLSDRSGVFTGTNNDVFCEFRLSPQVAISLIVAPLPDDIAALKLKNPDLYLEVVKPERIALFRDHDDLEFVRQFNRRATYFSYREVYGTSPNPPGLTVADPMYAP